MYYIATTQAVDDSLMQETFLDFSSDPVVWSYEFLTHGQITLSHSDYTAS